MAFNLRAILTLDDRMSGRLRQISRQMDSLNRMTTGAGSSVRGLTTQLSRANSMAGTFRGSMSGATTALTRTSTAATRASSSLSTVTRGGNLFTRGISSMASGVGGAISSIFSLNGALAALGTAYAAVNVSKNIFEATVGNAMQREQSGVIIDAMFNDKKASDAYKKMVTEFAINSPSMDSQQMFGNSKSFISMTKNVDELKGLWSIAERLAAVDPAQGVEGGVFAMREMLSGSSVSMARRFEMAPAELDKIKDLDVAGQVAGMNKLLEKMGMTQHLVDEMADTSLGRWMQIKEKWSLMLADMGAPALEPINKFFDDILHRFDSEDFKRFGNIGGKIIANIISGLTNAAIGIYDWFTALTHSPEFNAKTTLHSKIMFVIEDVFGRFTKWFNAEGKGHLEKAGKVVIEALAAAIDGSMEIIAPVAVKVGAALGQGVFEGFKGIISESGIASILTGNFTGYAEKRTGIDTSFKGIWNEAKSILSGGSTGQKKATPKAPQSTGKAIQLNKSGITPSRNGGLNYVPYDGATYRLHKGEAILTRGENEARRNGGGFAPISINGGIHLHGVGGNMEEAADKLLDILARKIQLAGEGGA